MNILGAKLRKILLDAEDSVHVDYLRFDRASDMYSYVKGECLLVKDQINQEDVEWLSRRAGKVDVFSMRAGSYSVSECIDKLKRVGIEVNFVDQIELNYVHSDQTLFVFKTFGRVNGGSVVPNTIRIYPVKRDEIIVPIAALKQCGKSEDFTDAELKGEDSRSADIALGDFADTNADSTVAENSNEKTEESEHSTKRDLLCQELKTRFDQNYSFVNVEFRGVHIERMSIPLSRFYEKNGISGGRLKGSWTLFEQNELNQIMDKGILDKAISAVVDKYTFRIPGYGRIIRVQKRNSYFDKISNIESDFKEYLSGKQQGKIGEIEIKKAFSPQTAIDKGLGLLEEYLNKLMPSSDKSICYHDNVSDFIAEQHEKCNDFSGKVSVKVEETSYRESQWKDIEFVQSIRSAFYEKKRKKADFLKEDEDFLELLEKYVSKD